MSSSPGCDAQKHFQCYAGAPGPLHVSSAATEGFSSPLLGLEEVFPVKSWGVWAWPWSCWCTSVAGFPISMRCWGAGTPGPLPVWIFPLSWIPQCLTAPVTSHPWEFEPPADRNDPGSLNLVWEPAGCCVQDLTG